MQVNSGCAKPNNCLEFVNWTSAARLFGAVSTVSSKFIFENSAPERCPMLDGAHVLILEDDPIIAFDLAATIEAADGCVVGPAGTVAAALNLVNNQDILGAILDANLPDGELTPVAILLIERGVPVIVHTGIGAPDELRERYPDVPVCLKPIASDRVVEALLKLMIERQPVSSENGVN